jgi:serine/threonine protein kinase
MAPEIFESKPYSIMADVYSFGVVVWEICSRETPYRNFQTPHAIMKYVTFDKGRPDLNSIQDGCNPTLRELMIRCWDHEPKFRPNF